MIWSGFVAFRYFGDYVWFLQPAFAYLLSVETLQQFFIGIADLMSFNTPDQYWLTARFTVFVSFLLNFLIIRLAFNPSLARVFLYLSLAIFLVSGLASPLRWEMMRLFMYHVMSLGSQPILILLLVPLIRVYGYIEGRNNSPKDRLNAAE